MDIGAGRGNFADIWRDVGELVDAFLGIVESGFVGEGEGVEDGVSGAAHGKVENEGVVDRFWRDDVAWANVVFEDVFDRVGGFGEEVEAVGVYFPSFGFFVDPSGRWNGAVAGHSEADDFGEAVHGVGGEHAGAGTAGAARFFGDFF